MITTSVQKLLEASERIDLPRQEIYKLDTKTKGFVITAFVGIAFALLCVILYVTGIFDKLMVAANLPVILLNIMAGLPAFALIYSLTILFTLGQAKAIFDSEGVSIPTYLPSRKIQLNWDDVEVARIREITTPLGQEIVLEVSDTGRFDESTVFPVMLEVKDQVKALRIIREKLGNRFVIS